MQQFERLFQFARRIEDLMYTIAPEEVSLQIACNTFVLLELCSNHKQAFVQENKKYNHRKYAQRLQEFRIKNFFSLLSFSLNI